MDKVNFTKALDAYRAPRGRFRVVEVPTTRYLMVDGHGDPNTSSEFTAAVESLYPIAYKLKFTSKKALMRDYVVPPLEGLWWADDMESFTAARDKSTWNWTAMIMVPDWIPEDTVTDVIAAAEVAGPVLLATLDEGLCVQTLHIGSFDDEGPVLAEMHEKYIPDNGFRMTGTHHEIYFSDFRRVPPEKRRTLLRQPVIVDR